MRCAAGLLTVLLVGGTQCAPAAALSPPKIDSDRLPAAAPAAPPERTVQRQTCAVPVGIGPHRDRSGADPLARFDLASVWKLTRGEGQRVAVIDTGVAAHPRLAHLEAGGDYVSSGDGTQDCDGHGTIVAGIIAAAPDASEPVPFSGLAPEATVLGIRQSSMRFGPAAEVGALGYGDVDTLARAVRTAADLGATVINISTVACREGGLDDGALGAALAYAVDTKDAVVVVAAGNIGGASQCPSPAEGTAADWASATVAVSPAWYDDYVLTVGSAAADGSASAFTLPGPWVDVAAPGESLLSLNAAGHGLTDALPGPDGASVALSGTSYAAPVVSGLVALVRARFPELSARQVMQRVEASARRPGRGWDPALGNGVIDPLAALHSEPAGTAPSTTPRPRPLESAATPTDDSETRARRIAFGGAAVCVLAVLLALAGPGRRRRRNPVIER